MTAELPEVSTLGYEQARDELVSIVHSLESGQAPLEDTLALWERGEALAAHCRSILDAATARLHARESRDIPLGEQSATDEPTPTLAD